MQIKNRIGYACTPISLPYKTTRSFLLKNFNEEIFIKCVTENFNDLMNILKWNVKNEIYMFRISSDTIPFASHSINSIKWWEIFEEEFSNCGKFIKTHNIRVSMHPGQYTVLNSPNEAVVLKSIKDLEYHCKFLDSLEVDYTNKIILHVGGVYNDKEIAMKRFVENFYKLSTSLQKRLVIENDDKNYTIQEVLSICDEIKIPVVFDNLHHKLNPCSLTWNEIISLVKNTWSSKDGPVKLHYSDQDEIKKGGAHSKTIVTDNFLDYIKRIKNLNADIMLEVKDKELSAIKCIHSLKESTELSFRMDQWAKYKYCVMEKGHSYYIKCNHLINSQVPMHEVYSYIDQCLFLPFDEENFRNVILHVYDDLKNKLTFREDEKLNTLLKNVIENKTKLKEFLSKLCKKYNVENVNDSYFFLY